MGKFFLQAFCDEIGKRRVMDLKVLHVTEWLAKMTTWNDGTKCGARSTLLACLNWAVDQGYVKENPLKKLKRGRHNRREAIFTTDELRRIREFTNPYFADFLLGLELTGARPFSELARIKARMVNWEESTITLEEHKNAKKTGKKRTIYLVPEMVVLLKKLALRHPEGLLFRNTRGKVWRSHDATRCLHYCTEKLGIKRGTIYGLRHYVCTNALEKGLSANVVAELVGNSPVTLTRYYDHLSSKRQTMLEAAKKAVG
jgi:integrase